MKLYFRAASGELVSKGRVIAISVYEIEYSPRCPDRAVRRFGGPVGKYSPCIIDTDFVDILNDTAS